MGIPVCLPINMIICASGWTGSLASVREKSYGCMVSKEVTGWHWTVMKACI